MSNETKGSGSTVADKPVEKKMVEIEATQLEGILARLEALEKEKQDIASGKIAESGEWREVKEFTGKRTAKIRCLNGNYLIDYIFDRKVWNEKKQEMEYIYKLTWLKPDSKTEVSEMSLSDLAKVEDRHDVTLESKESRMLEKVTGKTRKADVDYEKFKTNYGSLVDTKVTVVVTTWTVKLPDGRLIKLPESRLNS